jgi:hypothetical protein
MICFSTFFTNWSMLRLWNHFFISLPEVCVASRILSVPLW